jgi:hypothetical protein
VDGQLVASDVDPLDQEAQVILRQRLVRTKGATLDLLPQRFDDVACPNQSTTRMS